jgi:hypothetical protein
MLPRVADSVCAGAAPAIRDSIPHTNNNLFAVIRATVT